MEQEAFQPYGVLFSDSSCIAHDPPPFRGKERAPTEFPLAL